MTNRHNVTIHVFVGPTLPARTVLDILPEAVVHPPVAHGDLFRLRRSHGDVVVLVDGYYHHSAPIRHKEILALLDEGITVIGCASMGALRAAELAAYGMVGSGTVFGMYADDVIDADDEVAVAHSPDSAYRTFTVPLVTIRHAATLARSANVLTEGEATSIVPIAQRIHYAERTWGALRAAAARAPDDLAGAVTRLRSFIGTHAEADVKAADTLDTLRRLARGELTRRDAKHDWGKISWRNRYLAEWQAEFTMTKVDEVEVSHSALIRYQQLQRKDFSLRWQRFALGSLAGTGALGDSDLVSAALAMAARQGLTAESLTAEQLDHWLTPTERRQLSTRDAMVRLLVRSYQPPHPTRDLADIDCELVADPVAQQAVAEAEVINAEVASWGRAHTPDHLKVAVLQEHLAQLWQVEDADDAALLAAARDRGFASLDDAVDAVRPFFLRRRFLAGGPSHGSLATATATATATAGSGHAE